MRPSCRSASPDRRWSTPARADNHRCPQSSNKRRSLGCSQIGTELAGDQLRHVFLNLEPRLLDGAQKGQDIRAAVALDDDAAQAEEAGAVVFARIQPFL